MPFTQISQPCFPSHVMRVDARTYIRLTLAHFADLQRGCRRKIEHSHAPGWLRIFSNLDWNSNWSIHRHLFTCLTWLIVYLCIWSAEMPRGETSARAVSACLLAGPRLSHRARGQDRRPTCGRLQGSLSPQLSARARHFARRQPAGPQSSFRAGGAQIKAEAALKNGVLRRHGLSLKGIGD